MRLLKPLFVAALFTVLLTNCGSVPIISTPIENIDNTPLKENELTEKEKISWGHLDLVKDTIPGMSVDKAYNELLQGKKGKTVIVAVIDSGIDIEHEDLDGVVWTNTKERPNNGKDDDKNGFVDDIHGWNFLGDAYDEQMEYVRLLASGNSQHPRYVEANAEYQKEFEEKKAIKTQYEQLLQQINTSDEAVSRHLGKKVYSQKEVIAIKTDDQTLLQHKNVIIQTYGFDLGTITETKTYFNDGIKSFAERLNVHLNKDLKGRKTGDNPDIFSDKPGYGNGNVKPQSEDESHGTHVAGIIAAERNNGKGANGVANTVKIMALRTVPNGDEYDKDVALAIRYAADNGAKIINMSFGKYYSPHSDWVKEAIIYAETKDVLLISGAGNESLNLDNKSSYPQDNENGAEFANNFISIGATEEKYGSGMVAYYSNYGKSNVDVFAPGSNIYSTYPNNTYKAEGGTSMAAPAVAGIAALIRSYYPKLKAAQVKEIILNSGLPIKAKVVVAGKPENVRSFSEICKSGKIVNAYNALVMASQMSR